MVDPDPLDEDSFEENIRRRQRIKLWAGMALAVVVAGGLLAAYLILWKEAPKARCRGKEVEKLLASKKAPGEAVYKVCSLPEPLERTLERLLTSPPETHRLLVFKLVADSPEYLTRVCPEGPRALAAALAQPPGTQSEEFLKQCNLRPTGLGTRRELEQTVFHRLILAVAVFGTLISTDRPWALKLGRKLLVVHE